MATITPGLSLISTNYNKDIGILGNLLNYENPLAGLASEGVGYFSSLLGQGVSNLAGNSRTGQSFGSGISAGLGTIGGTIANNFVSTGSILGGASKLFGTGDTMWTTTKSVSDAAGNITKSTAAAINPYALGMSVLGTALGSATGPSKEYNGKYGGITRTMDSVYDAATVAANFIPGIGQTFSGAMALNKGLSNIFGSTDAMTKTDAILGSAFMLAPIKWVNMWGSSKTGGFNNLSWLNTEKTNTFMGDAFGNLGYKFDKARKEAGKVYGTFSRSAKRRAQRNIDLANSLYGKVLDMADLNELQNIRSLYMTSINNQRYALNIQGGWNPTAIGKHGMKILNNATNHNIGMRLLSGAALIDNKQMILCSAAD